MRLLMHEAESLTSNTELLKANLYQCHSLLKFVPFLLATLHAVRDDQKCRAIMGIALTRCALEGIAITPSNFSSFVLV